VMKSYRGATVLNMRRIKYEFCFSGGNFTSRIVAEKLSTISRRCAPEILK